MRPHVMVVEDDETLLPLIARTLEMEGYRVTRAACAAEALAQLARGVPDLVVSDIMMPDVDGYGLLEQLRGDARWTRVPVVFLTALGDEASIERGRRLGVDHYLVKPFTPAQLLATVSGTLRRYAELRSGGVIAGTPDAAPRAVPGVLPTGIGPVDAQVGGLTPARVYLVTGDFGAAKQVLALTALSAALARGDRALLVTTDRLDTVLYLARNAGLALREAVRTSRLVVSGLVEGFEEQLDCREDVAALGSEIAAWAAEHACTHVVMTGVLTVLCSTPRLPLSAPLMTELVGALERSGATTLLVADEPVTPAEELADAYLRRAVFGTLIVRKDPSAAGRGILALEAMRGVAGDPPAQSVRIVPGAGLAAVDPAAELDAGECVRVLREHADLAATAGPDEPAALVARRPAGWRLRDPFVLFLRDCLATARRATARVGIVVLPVPHPPLHDVRSAGPARLEAADVTPVLGPLDVLCWFRPSELAVVTLGGDAAATRALAARLTARVDEALRERHVSRGACAASVHGGDGEPIDALLARLEHQLSDADAPPTARPAVA